MSDIPECFQWARRYLTDKQIEEIAAKVYNEAFTMKWRILRVPNGYYFVNSLGVSFLRTWEEGWYPLAAEEFLNYLNGRSK